MSPEEDWHVARQQALIDLVGDQYVEACPGAGKTWVILGRYARRVTEEARKGVALLSFTNAAIDEIAGRSKTSSRLLDSPNFVGTFDSFIHRFIVTPGFIKQTGLRPRYCESWSQLNDTGIHSGKDLLLLDELAYEPDNTVVVDYSRVPTQRRGGIESKPSMLDRAIRRLNGLVKAGNLSCEIARHFAYGYLKDETLGPVLLRRIAARFTEVIVDEGQDCGREEIEILRRLKSVGVTVFFMCDPHQGIFEFRRATPELIAQFAAELPQTDRLSGNRRSSPGVCSIAASVASLEAPDEAIGQHADCGDKIVVLVSGDPKALRLNFEALLEEREQEPSNGIVLAHSRARAHEVAGKPVRAPQSASRLLALAGAVDILRAERSPRLRRSALETIHRQLIRLFNVDVGDHSTRSACEGEVIDERWLKRSASVLVSRVRLPSTVTAEEFLGDIIEVSGLLQPPRNGELGSVRQALPRPSEQLWATLRETDDPSGLRSGTIHSVKGMEFDSVLLVLDRSLRRIDGRNVLDAWNDGIDNEAKRVLYVGLTRAERTLALGVTPSQARKTVAILKRDGVPFEVREL